MREVQRKTIPISDRDAEALPWRAHTNPTNRRATQASNSSIGRLNNVIFDHTLTSSDGEPNIADEETSGIEVAEAATPDTSQRGHVHGSTVNISVSIVYH